MDVSVLTDPLVNAALPSRLFEDDPFVSSPGVKASGLSSQELSRRSTPALPPGLPIPSSSPAKLDFWSSTATKHDEQSQEFSMPELGRIPQKPSINDSTNKETLKETSQKKVSKGSEKAAPKQPPVKAQKPATPQTTAVLDDNAFPELPKRPTTSDSKETAKAPTKENIPATSNMPSSMKRKAPGRLDISAVLAQQATEDKASAVPDSAVEGSVASTPSRATKAETIASEPQAEGTPVVETPVKRVGPRTLRVVQTPKVESPKVEFAAAGLDRSRAATPSVEVPPVVSSAASAVAARSVGAQTTSRKGSFASIHAPGTPLSEKPSDTFSVTTDSPSRAESPAPGNRVGSAPTRAKTKSQAKKERQERAKALADEVLATTTEVTTPEADVVQAPLMGRKKKSKKPTAAPAPLKPKPVKPEVVKPEPVKPEAAKPEPAKVESANVEPAKSEPKPAEVPKPAPEEKSQPVAAPPEPKPAKPTKKAAPTAAAEEAARKAAAEQARIAAEQEAYQHWIEGLISTLYAEGQIKSPNILDLFKDLTAFDYKVSLEDFTAPPSYAPLNADELALLDSGEPVRRGGSGGAARLLVTPLTRQCVQGLSVQLEEQVLAYEAAIAAQPAPLRYNHQRRTGNSNGTAAAAAFAQDAARVLRGNPVPATQHKAYGDDALAYLNQFILPAGARAAESSIGAPIPRTYTTGDPTYSVAGVDNVAVNPHAVGSTSAPAFTPPPPPHHEQFHAKHPSTKSGSHHHHHHSTNTVTSTSKGEAEDVFASQSIVEAAQQLALSVRNLAGGLAGATGTEEDRASAAEISATVKQLMQIPVAGWAQSEAPSSAPPAKRGTTGGAGKPEYDPRQIEAMLHQARREYERIGKALLGKVEQNRKLVGLSR